MGFFTWAPFGMLPTLRRRLEAEAIAKDPAAHARRVWRTKYVAAPLAVLWVVGVYGYVLSR